jgi:hypothetical protein
MKRIFTSVVASISTFIIGTKLVLVQSLPTADLSVWNSDSMKPVRSIANITIGVIFGLAVLYAVIMIAYYGIRLQSSGSDLMKSQEAKNGLKGTVIGVVVTLAAIFIIGLILHVLGIVGLTTTTS